MSNTNGFVNLPTGIYLNVRKEPNLYSQVLTSLAPKTELTIIEQNGEWYEIEYNNEKAYVFAEAVTPSSSIILGGMTLNLNIPNNFEFGDSGEQPTFNWNALVTTSFIPIKTINGEVKSGYGTSNGDHITIIKDNPQNGLTFIQYPDQGGNLYQQGWIDSTYISESYLDFRFEGCWTNLTDSQEIYLFNDAISTTTLSKDTNYILLYTVTNYNIEYSCILFEENNSLKTGFIPSTTGKLNFLVDNYPFAIPNESSINSYLPTVSLNAVVKKSIELIDINGIKPNYYTNSKKEVIYPTLEVGTEIAIIQVFNSAEEDSMLIEYFDKGSNTYLKAYLPTESLFNNSVSINQNIVTWNTDIKTVNLSNLSNTKKIYELETSQSIQYLYSSNGFACILFNNNNLAGWPLQTAYVSLSKGSFKTKQEIIDDSFSAEIETLYFSENNIVINANINSKNIFDRALSKKLVLRSNNTSQPTLIATTPVNWYSSNKDSYSGLQVIITPEITKLLLKNVNYNLSIQFTLNNDLLELPVKNLLPVSLIHNSYYSLNETANKTIYLTKLLPSITTVNQGKAIAMDGYWNSYGYTLNAEINIPESITNTDKIMLISEDNSLSVLGTNVSWYSNNKSTYNGAQFSIKPTDLSNISSSTELYIDVYIGSTIYHMPLTSTINTDSDEITGITYGINIENNDVNISKY